MFQEHGDFSMMEVQIKRKVQRSKECNRVGGWYSASVLEKIHGWNQPRA